MSCQSDEREAGEGRCTKVSAVDGSSPLRYGRLRAIGSLKVGDERTGERGRGNGKITADPIPVGKKKLAPAECGGAAGGSPGDATTCMSLRGRPIPEGKHQHEKMARH